jgi:aryl-alcohol dehydrogenase-like predicted oxidoreductase
MKYRSFGARTGLQVSELVLGTGLLGQAAGYGPDPATVREVFDRYLRAGGNILDLSDAYQAGESERVVGALVQPVRDELVLVSKYCRSASTTPGRAAVGSGRKVMMQSVDASLRRLRTDRIDVYLLHLDDGATPIDELARGFDDLVRAGKIIHGGLSNTPAWRAAAIAATAAARGDSPIAALQLEYNLFERTSDRELLPMARAFGLAVMGYSPLAAGLLTAKYRAGERGRATELARSVSHADTDRNTPILDEVVAIAAELAVRPGQVAIAWAIAQGVLPIIGARTPDQLAESLAAAELPLSASQLARLDAVSRMPAGYPHELLARYVGQR